MKSNPSCSEWINTFKKCWHWKRIIFQCFSMLVKQCIWLLLNYILIYIKVGEQHNMIDFNINAGTSHDSMLGGSSHKMKSYWTWGTSGGVSLWLNLCLKCEALVHPLKSIREITYYSVEFLSCMFEFLSPYK